MQIVGQMYSHPLHSFLIYILPNPAEYRTFLISKQIRIFIFLMQKVIENRKNGINHVTVSFQ